MDSPYGPAHESYRVITHDRTLTSVKFEWQTRLNGNPDIAERPLSLRNPHLYKYPSPLPDFLSTPSPPSSNYFLLLDPQVTNNQQPTPHRHPQVCRKHLPNPLTSLAPPRWKTPRRLQPLVRRETSSRGQNESPHQLRPRCPVGTKNGTSHHRHRHHHHPHRCQITSPTVRIPPRRRATKPPPTKTICRITRPTVMNPPRRRATKPPPTKTICRITRPTMMNPPRRRATRPMPPPPPTIQPVKLTRINHGFAHRSYETVRVLP
jgi:hypothetical protein